MKRLICSSMSFVVGLTSLTAFAQNPPVGVSVIGGAGSGQTGFLSAGRYDINKVEQDTTKLLSEAMAHLGQMQKIDREYLHEIKERLLNGQKRLIGLGQKFRELSQKSAMGLVTFEEYLKLLNEIRVAEQNFTAELQALTLVTRETLPSSTQVSVGGITADIGAAGNINMAPVAQRFGEARDALLAELNSLQFPNLVTPRNQRKPVLANALNPDLSGFQILSPDEVRAKTQELNDLLALDGSTQRLQRQYIERLRIDLRKFVQNYGTEEAFRFRDDNDKNAKLQGWALLQDAFYRRSYLRRKYGIPMGALRTVKYEKNMANIEKFTESFRSLNEYLMMIEPQAAINRDEVMEAFENARNFVQLYDEKVTPIFSKNASQKYMDAKSRTLDENASFFDRAIQRGANAKTWVSSQFADREEIMSQADKKLEYSSADTGFLVRANSALTFLTGRQPTAEVLLAVMRMVLADAREEMMLLQNDRAALQAYHNQRFNSTAELKADSAKRICQMDFSLSEATHQANCAPLGIKIKPQAPRGQPGNDISGLFLGLLNQFELVEKKKALDAENIRQLIIAANAAGNSEESQAVEDSLFE